MNDSQHVRLHNSKAYCRFIQNLVQLTRTYPCHDTNENETEETETESEKKATADQSSSLLKLNRNTLMQSS